MFAKKTNMVTYRIFIKCNIIGVQFGPYTRSAA